MILVAVRDLVFRSKIHAASERLGVPVRLAPRGAPLEQAARESGGGTILADLSEPGVLEGVRAAKRAGASRVVGYLCHRSKLRYGKLFKIFPDCCPALSPGLYEL